MPIKRINLLQYVEKDDDNLVGKFLTNLPLLLVMYYLLYKTPKSLQTNWIRKQNLEEKGGGCTLWKRGFYIDFIVQFHGKLIAGH